MEVMSTDTGSVVLRGCEDIVGACCTVCRQALDAQEFTWPSSAYHGPASTCHGIALQVAYKRPLQHELVLLTCQEQLDDCRQLLI